MDIAGDMRYTFEEQCSLQIARLRAEILAESESRKKPKNSHRLFRYNIFENIDPVKRQNLTRTLCNTLRILGQHIDNNLREASKRKELSLRTPSLDLSRSERTQSMSSRQSTSPISYSLSPSESNSECSEILDPVSEVIFISSDEENEYQDIGITIKSDPCIVSRNVTTSPESSIDPAEATIGLEEVQIDGSDTSRGPKQKIMNNLQSSKNVLFTVDRENMANFTYDSSGVIHMKSKKYIKFSASQINKQGLILHIIVRVLNLIENKLYTTKRELFYKCLDFCRSRKKTGQVIAAQGSLGDQTQTQPLNQTQTQGTSQSISTITQSGSQIASQQLGESIKYNMKRFDTALDDLCCLVGCSKVHLHIIAQPKGIIYGDLKFKLETGEKLNCLEKKEGTLLPTGQAPIIELESNAKFVIVIEKDSVLQNILSQETTTNFVKNYHCLLFTAKGYPDALSRSFLNYLWSRLKVPILALTDADPHGFEIACSYKFGCYSSAYDPYLVVPDMKWLGLLPSEVVKISNLESKTLPLSLLDHRKINSLLQRPYLKSRKEWLNQLNLMQSTGRKAELESLDFCGQYLVGTYLPNKLRYASWL